MIEPLHRRIPIRVTIFVLALHGLAVWASTSIESPERPLLLVESAQAIQIELIQSTAIEPSIPSITSKSLVTEDILSPENKEVIIEPVKVEPIEEVVITTNDSVEEVSIKSLVDDVQVNENETKNNANQKDSNRNKESSNRDVNTGQNKNEQSNNATEDAETDLSAIIRAMRAKYISDQNSQRRNLNAQDNRRFNEQAKLRQQNDFDAINKLLTLAEKQAELQKEQIEKTETKLKENKRLNPDFDQDELFTVFSENDAIWLAEHQPITDIPLIVWRNAKARSGDLFIVILELHVDKEGYITEVQLLESSGNPIIDAVATTQVRTGQLEPLMVDNVAVAAIVPISLVYETP